jgi:hypothetical protein
MDGVTKSMLFSLSLPDVICIELTEVEDESLLLIKPGRTAAEYCWTLSASLPWYIFQRNQCLDEITYLDADLMFYSDVHSVFAEIGDAPIAVIEHRFTERLKHLEVNGRFCVEWVTFRRVPEAMKCLDRWRVQCIDWCFYRLEENRMGDQKYLDEWPTLYPGLYIIRNLGAGVAPWNYAQYDFGKNRKDQITVNGTPLIFYHFHQFQLLENGQFERLSNFYTDECKEPISIYEKYEFALISALAKVRVISPFFSYGLKPRVRTSVFVNIFSYFRSMTRKMIRRFGF